MSLIKRSREEADRMAREKREKARIEQEAECKRIAAMFANMTEEEKKEYWEKAAKSWEGAEDFWVR